MSITDILKKLRAEFNADDSDPTDFLEAAGFRFADDWNPDLDYIRDSPRKEEVIFDLDFEPERWIAKVEGDPEVPGLARLYDELRSYYYQLPQ